MSHCILAIDQGTTSSRAIVFDENRKPLANSAQEFQQIYPNSGWVEHDSDAIWETVLSTARHALKASLCRPEDVLAIGITNQRETIVVWDRKTGRPIHNAIVWQDRRTSDICRSLKDQGQDSDVRRRTGLPLDPYFSATKIAWILDHVPRAREQAARGALAAGTIDTFLVWKLTGGAVHATDVTNASRTALFNIHSQCWDDELLGLFQIPPTLLPEVRDCTADFGETLSEWFGTPIPIRGIAGDQQAATIGQACFQPGMLKSTYGTGCFALLNTGQTPVLSQHNLLTTIASRINGRTTYALEGSIYVAGAGVQWLRDGLKILPDAAQADAMAANADPNQQIVLVPAFVGLGAPYWDADCRGALFGLTRNTGPNELVKATLEAVCFQTADLLEAMKKDWQDLSDIVLRVDGGMSASNWTMQCLADMLDCPVERPENLETTALGAAYLAGLAVDFYPKPDVFAQEWSMAKRFESALSAEQRETKMRLWHDGVKRTLSTHKR